ncbi:MAG: proline--tRNA ligase [Euryarchaeota archaeon]|nr:proline--tRNA ligase [Euryarchaeota archaeon]MDE1837016.1 proline--tRNA ligase [Euryarchaeota archaeon]MDE1879866.1 proline--tRNA ligase [Euryarchaeota archaeon]MDE2045674.1 proline--tRNA ligase [Thermoplasmata archaeon]
MSELPKKEGNFFEWYNEVLERSQVTDKRYPVKGLNVWPPFGLSIRSLFDQTLRNAVGPIGYQEVSFPTLIPETELKKESEHIKGFEAEVYWVTRGGNTPLDINLCLRPTSETAMYPMFALWVRSHKDLPLRTFQICNVFRYETKSTRPLLRIREIHFYEGHTVHPTEESATRQVQEDLGSFEQVARSFALPYLINKRPEWDKFPGAHYSLGLDIPFGDARTLQVGTVHHYRDNFAKPYGIQYETEDGKTAFGHQTTYGISERLIGGVVGVHGDEKGLVLPPALAPVQVAIVPVPGKGSKEAVEGAARALGSTLSAGGLRVKVDLSEDRPGAKYYAWESRGVPLRIELGPREVEEKAATLADRFGKKRKVPQAELLSEVRAELESFLTTLADRAQARFRDAIARAKELSDLKGPKAVYLIGWCGKEACGHKVEEVVEGGLLGTIEGGSPADIVQGEAPPCIVCGSGPSRWAAAGRPI